MTTPHLRAGYVVVQFSFSPLLFVSLSLYQKQERGDRVGTGDC
jgi:hypothetical protein